MQARRYPRNSSEAAARIVVLALLANGHFKASELQVLAQLRAREQLGLSDAAWHDVIEDLCEDVIASAGPRQHCRIDSTAIVRLLAEVDDERLQRIVLRLCAAVAEADGDLDEGEALVLRTAVEQWVLEPEDLQLVEPLLYGLDFQVVPRQRDSCD